jgi:dsRNA-specific ribonuclease
VTVAGQTAEGTGSSKRLAETAAAQSLLESLKS